MMISFHCRLCSQYWCTADWKNHRRGCSSDWQWKMKRKTLAEECP